MFQPGLTELIVGKNASKTYVGMKLGETLKLGRGHWKVVGVFDAGALRSTPKVWCDSKILNEVLKRPDNIFQSATVHLTSSDASTPSRTLSVKTSTGTSM